MDLVDLWQRIETATKRLATGRHGPWGIAVATFLESSVIPVPVELFLVPAFLSDRARAWHYATAALLGCLAASAAFYGIGWLVFDTLGQSLVAYLNIEDRMAAFEQDIQQMGFWLIFLISFLPLPLQVATLGSGAFAYPFVPFLIAIALSRLARFHGLAALTLILGSRAERALRHRSPLWKPVILIGCAIAFVTLSLILV